MADKEKIKAVWQSTRLRRYVLRTVIAVAAFGVFGFLILPPVLKSVAVDKLGVALHRPVSIEKISINPYALTLQIDGFAVKERQGETDFVRFDTLFVNLQAASVFRGGPVIGEVRLVAPKVHLVREAVAQQGTEARYNFSDLLDEFLARPKNDDPVPAFSVNNIQVLGGNVEFDDEARNEKHVVSDIDLSVPFVSSMAYASDIFVEPQFSAKVNGAPLVIGGRAKPFAASLESEISLQLNDLKLAALLDYSPVKLPLKLQSGSLDTALNVVFHQDKDKPAALEVSGKVDVKDFDLRESSGTPLASWQRLDLAIAPSDLLAGRYRLDKVALASPQVHVRVGAQGELNWLALMPTSPAGAGKTAHAAAHPSAALSWVLAQASISDGTLFWLDESHAQAFKASVDKIAVDLRQLSSTGGQPATLDLSWRLDAGDNLGIERVAIKDGKLDLNKRQLVLGSVEAQDAHALIKRGRDGALEWIVPPSLHVDQAPAAAAGVNSEAPWSVAVAKLHSAGTNVRFEDAAVSPSVVHSVENMTLDLDNVTTQADAVTQLATRFKLNRQGEVALSGSVSQTPLAADLKVDVKGVELLPWQPYFADRLNVEVTRGQLAMNGDLRLRQGATAKAGGPTSNGNPGGWSGGFSGQATIGDFNAVDKTNAADFLRWKSFYFGKVDARLAPDSLSIGEVALADFYARVIVSPEGKLNLMQIVRQPDAAPVAVVPETAATPEKKVAAAATPAKSEQAVASPAEPAASKPNLPIKIGRITLQGGNVRFTDNFVKPNYTADLRKIAGSLSGLSSAAESTADLQLRGSYDDVAPLSVTAKINPLAAKPFLDLQAEVKGVELTSLSTYAGKYAGYEIDKGKLSVFVKYKVENGQLTAENRVFLDQLTFGDAVASPDATKLPVKLAIALLKNRNGEIDINLPISGSLSDPQFSVGGIVVKMIVNLFVKAVTSPFALIGSMFGSGEELSFVDFDYGYAALTADSEKRLEHLSKALLDRPALKIEIAGQVDVEQDREGLKTARIQEKVRALKHDDQGKSVADSASQGNEDVSADEYPALLERVYRAAKFPKPRNVVGMVKTLPVEEMEKLLLANTTIDEDDLIDLGERRAKVVREWLVAHQIPVDRIFLLPTKQGGEKPPANSDKPVKQARADFSLK